MKKFLRNLKYLFTHELKDEPKVVIKEVKKSNTPLRSRERYS